MQEGIFYRVVGTWNTLPEYIRRLASVNSFKVFIGQQVFLVDKYMRLVFLLL